MVHNTISSGTPGAAAQTAAAAQQQATNTVSNTATLGSHQLTGSTPPTAARTQNLGNTHQSSEPSRVHNFFSRLLNVAASPFGLRSESRTAFALKDAKAALQLGMDALQKNNTQDAIASFSAYEQNLSTLESLGQSKNKVNQSQIDAIISKKTPADIQSLISQLESHPSSSTELKNIQQSIVNSVCKKISKNCQSEFQQISDKPADFNSQSLHQKISLEINAYFGDFALDNNLHHQAFKPPQTSQKEKDQATNEIYGEILKNLHKSNKHSENKIFLILRQFHTPKITESLASKMDAVSLMDFNQKISTIPTVNSRYPILDQTVKNCVKSAVDFKLTEIFQSPGISSLNNKFSQIKDTKDFSRFIYATAVEIDKTCAQISRETGKTVGADDKVAIKAEILQKIIQSNSPTSSTQFSIIDNYQRDYLNIIESVVEGDGDNFKSTIIEEFRTNTMIFNNFFEKTNNVNLSAPTDYGNDIAKIQGKINEFSSLMADDLKFKVTTFKGDYNNIIYQIK